MIKAVIFDVDDTLIKTSDAKYEAHKHTAKKFYKLNLTTEQIRSHWGKPFPMFIGDLYGPVDSIENIIYNYRSVRNNFPSLAYEDSIQTIKDISMSYITGLLTAGTRSILEEDLQIAGFDIMLFHYIQTADQTTVHKPDPAVFKPILNMLAKKNITASQIVYVGDSLDDFKAAKGNGLQFIGMAGRTTAKEKFEKDTYLANHFLQLLKIIKSIK